jgi:hypothetical protein
MNLRHMMRRLVRAAALGILVLPFDAVAAGSLLRVACEGGDAGAEVTINGVFKGECPLDIQVNEGTVQLRVLKKVDASRERVFEQQFRIGDGVVKKIEVALSAPRLNAEAQRRESERIAAEREEAMRREQARQLARAAEEQADRELRQQQQKAIEAGDATAMIAFAERYETGKGVPKNEAEARSWLKRAADAGNPVAAFRLTDLYKNGRKEDVADIVRMLAFPSGEERAARIEGEEQVRAFMAKDTFFEVPGGNEKISYWYEARYAANAVMRSDITCVRNGRYFDVSHNHQSKDFSSTGDATGALGALVWLTSKSSTGLFRTNQQVITRIDRLSGRPFPLTPGKRFGMSFVTRLNGDAKLESATTTTCGVIGDKTAIPRQDGVQGHPVMCLQQTATFAIPMRMYWHEQSGCFLMADTK